MPRTLITGPTAGIGLAFARAVAKRGHDVVLVARRKDRLAELADELRGAYGVEAELIPADLANNTAAVEERLRDADRPIDMLINNAGFGMHKPFLANEIADEERMLDVMVRAVLRLTHAALPGMIERGHGAIMNVSSVAALVPRGTYSAAKAWVTAFSEGLKPQLNGTGVRIMALAPGYTRTEFHDRAGMNMSSLPSWMWLDAEHLVEAALKDLAKGKNISVPGSVYKVAAVALPRLPRRFVIAAGQRHPDVKRRRRR